MCYAVLLVLCWCVVLVCCVYVLLVGLLFCVGYLLIVDVVIYLRRTRTDKLNMLVLVAVRHVASR